MIVVRRRKDGLFYRNRAGTHTHRRGAASEWTDNLNEVKPYANKAGALHSFGAGQFYWGPGWEPTPNGRDGRKSTFVDECCKAVKWTRNGTKHQCEHYKAKRTAELARFYEKYEILEVEIGLRLK